MRTLNMQLKIAPSPIANNMALRRVLQKGFCRSAGIPKSGAGCTGGGFRMMSTIDNSNNSWDDEPKPSRTSHWLMLRPSFDDESGDVVYNFHSLANKQRIAIPCKNKRSQLPFPNDINDVEFVGSSHGWLALYNRRNKDLFLSNPITNRHIKLPPLHSLPDPLINSEGGVSRVVVSCSPDENDTDGCRVMMTVGRVRRLAFCVPGRSKEWTLVGGALYCERVNAITYRSEMAPREYEDVVYSSRHKLFFCITRLATELESWNVGDPLSPWMEWRVQHNDELNFNDSCYPWPCHPVKAAYLSEREELGVKQECWHLKYLVFSEQRDELFLVVRHVNPRLNYDGSIADRIYYSSKFRGCDYSYHYQTIDFTVYKIDDRTEGGGKLRHMKESLEGLAMFVGINQSYAVPASEYPELEPNAIYFCDENRLMLLSRSYAHCYFGGHDNGIFNYETKTFSSCCGRCVLNPLDYYNIERIDPPPLWFTPPAKFG